MQSSFAIVLVLLISTVFAAVLPAANAAAEGPVLLTISNVSSQALLLTSIEIERTDKSRFLLFIGNLMPGSHCAVPIYDLRAKRLCGLVAIVESRRCLYDFQVKEGEAAFRSLAPRVFASSLGKLELATVTLQKGQSVSIATPIMGVELTDLAYDNFPKPLNDARKIDSQLHQLMTTPLLVPYSSIAAESESFFCAYTVAYTNGWYASLLGDLTSTPLPLTSLWASCHRFAPPDTRKIKLAPLIDGLYDPFSPNQTPAKKTAEQQSNIQRFQTLVQDGFMSGHKAGLKALQN